MRCVWALVIFFCSFVAVNATAEEPDSNQNKVQSSESKILRTFSIDPRMVAKIGSQLDETEQQAFQEILNRLSDSASPVNGELLKQYVEARSRRLQDDIDLSTVELHDLMALNNVTGQLKLIRVLQIVNATLSQGTELSLNDIFIEAQALTIEHQYSSEYSVQIRRGDVALLPDGRRGVVNEILSESRARVEVIHHDNTRSVLETDLRNLIYEIPQRAIFRTGDAVLLNEVPGEIKRLYSDGSALVLVEIPEEGAYIELVQTMHLKPANADFMAPIRVEDQVLLKDGRLMTVKAVNITEKTVTIVGLRRPVIDAPVYEEMTVSFQEIAFPVHRYETYRENDRISIPTESGYLTGIVENLFSNGRDASLRVRLDRSEPMGFNQSVDGNAAEDTYVIYSLSQQDKVDPRALAAALERAKATGELEEGEEDFDEEAPEESFEARASTTSRCQKRLVDPL